MKPVGDWRRIGRALPNTGGIRFRSVSGHPLDLGRSLEPSGNGFRGPVFQSINRTAPFEIDPDGSVSVPFAPGPIIAANDFCGSGPSGRARCRTRRRRVLRLSGTP
jgi:hypothetical protein